VCGFAGLAALADNQGIFIRSRGRRRSDSHERKQTRKCRNARQPFVALGDANVLDAFNFFDTFDTFDAFAAFGGVWCDVCRGRREWGREYSRYPTLYRVAGSIVGSPTGSIAGCRGGCREVVDRRP
jgi:hypothetical protein